MFKKKKVKEKEGKEKEENTTTNPNIQEYWLVTACFKSRGGNHRVSSPSLPLPRAVWMPGPLLIPNVFNV